MRMNPWKLFHGAIVPNWLLLRPELTQGAKLCYARLCEYAGERGFAYPSQQTLATQLGVSHIQTKRYVAELVKWKLVEMERRGMGQTSVYYFLAHEWMGMIHHSGIINDTSDGSYMIHRKDSVEKTHINTTRGVRAHVLPERMELTLERSLRAIKLGVPEAEIQRQWERFVNYYSSTGSKRVNWDLAWDGWCDNYRPHPPSSANPPSPRMSQGMANLVRKMRETKEAEDDRARGAESPYDGQGHLVQTTHRRRDN